MLTRHLDILIHSMHVSSGDADTIIVEEAMNFAINLQSVTVVPEDKGMFCITGSSLGVGCGWGLLTV